MGYEPHETLVAPARPSAHPLRLAAGIVATIVVFLTLSMGFSNLHKALVPDDMWQRQAEALRSGTTPAAVLVNLGVFGLLIVALAVALAVVHRRRIGSLLGPWRLALAQFRRVGLALLVLVAVVMVLPEPMPLRPDPNLSIDVWLMLLPAGVLAVLIQTSAEELVFRGYLQSQLAARFAHPAVWMGAPAALFAVLHLDTAAHGDNTWLVVTWAACFGLAAADLTARSGTLGPAIALHFVNNLNAILIAAPQGYFDGLALYVYPFSLEDPGSVWTWFPADLLLLGCSWLTARVALRR